jgi:predicted nucleotide-binding protein (sugar kinase/HSP70/actin superfamily)
MWSNQYEKKKTKIQISGHVLVRFKKLDLSRIENSQLIQELFVVRTRLNLTDFIPYMAPKHIARTVSFE